MMPAMTSPCTRGCPILETAHPMKRATSSTTARATRMRTLTCAAVILGSLPRDRTREPGLRRALTYDLARSGCGAADGARSARRTGEHHPVVADLTTDVLVIGGGPAGSAVSMRMLDRGIRPLIVERESFP